MAHPSYDKAVLEGQKKQRSQYHLDSFSAKAIGKDWPSFKQLKEVYRDNPKKYKGSPDKILNYKLDDINKRQAAKKRSRPKYSK